MLWSAHNNHLTSIPSIHCPLGQVWVLRSFCPVPNQPDRPHYLRSGAHVGRLGSGGRFHLCSCPQEGSKLPWPESYRLDRSKTCPLCPRLHLHQKSHTFYQYFHLYRIP